MRALGARLAQGGSGMTLRFLFPTTFYPPFSFGGDAVAVQRLARALVRRGHEVTVVHDIDAYTAVSRGHYPQAPASTDGVEVIALHSSLGHFSPLLAHQTGSAAVHRRTLRGLFQSGRFDVVNFHNTSLIGGPGIFGIPTSATRVYSAHEHWLVCPTHVLWRHKREVCPERQCLRCQLRYHRPPQLWRYSPNYKKLLKCIDLYIAMSEFSRQKHKEFGFPEEMSVLPPFSDEPQYDENHKPWERPYFFFAGRLEQIKGLQTVLPLLSQIPEVDVLVAGQGSLREELEAQAGPQVKFLGRAEPRTLSSLYRGAIATIVPSITYETFGLTVVESFATGTPVIARRLGPLPDIVESCDGGLVFSTDEELVNALKRLAFDASLRARLGANARKGFEERWSESAVVPRYIEMVESARRKKQ
jgi:glycosyltransferase involved in cell wall biosynthesis